jgi:hypothetical protein
LKKLFIPLICAAFVLAIAVGNGGCGGGGGGSGTTTTTGTTTGLSIRAEAALAGNPSQPIDPLNIQAGESVQFQIVGYDVNRVRTILASSNWTTNDNGNKAGVLQPDGSFSATAPTGATIYTASGVSGGKTYTESYRVRPVQALVTGFVMDSNGFGASHVAIVFFGPAGAEIGRAIVQSDGSFRASVPNFAARFSLDSATMPKQFYYKSFVFQTKRYSTLVSSCTAPLPALSNGVTTPIGTVTIDAAETNGTPNPPPPPPNGCPV